MNAQETKRFDVYNANQMLIARTAIPALILLNSAPFLVILNDVSNIATSDETSSLVNAATYWGVGAMLGVLTWLCTYLNSLCVTEELKTPSKNAVSIGIYLFLWLGVLMTIGSIWCFGAGVWTLAGLNV